MPRTVHNIGRQRSDRFEICTNGLLTLRGQQLKHLRLNTNPDAQANIDAIDRILIDVIGYTGDIQEASRDFRRETTFKRGELRRAVADVLRGANEPMKTRKIAELVMKRKGVDMSDWRVAKERIARVRAVLKAMAVDKGVGINGEANWARM